MIPRGLWFAAGAGAGIYAMTRARRLAEGMTAEGLSHKWHGLTVGWQMFADEFGTQARAHEDELRQRYGLVPPAPHGLPELTSGSQMSRKREND